MRMAVSQHQYQRAQRASETRKVCERNRASSSTRSSSVKAIG
jgi:hypothetical protein